MASPNEFQEAVERAKRIAKQLAEQGKRAASDEDGGEPAAKRFGGFANGAPAMPGMNGAFGGQQTQEDWFVPNRMVGLIIGKGGENIGRIQDTCGAKLQLGQEPSGDKRSCVIYGTPQAIAKCKEMVQEIVDKEGQRNQFNPTGGLGAGGGYGGAGLGMGLGLGAGGPPQGPQATVEVHVPKHKVGQIIGKGGETIRSLQDKARVRMFLIQDVDPASPTKPIKITGDPERVEHARQLVEEMINQPDGPGGDRGGQVQEQIRVPRQSVGVIIGKGGETIRDIQSETGARIQFVDLHSDNPNETEKTCLISGRPPQVQEAKRMVEGLLANSAQMAQQKLMMGAPQMHQKPRFECEEVFKVPAARTGVVIGKGGETIRMICERSGAKVELDRNHPQTADDRIFHIRGSRECVEAAKQIITEKIAEQPRGFGGDNRGPSGGPNRNWEGGHGGGVGGGGGYNQWDSNAGGGDPANAFWQAYCQQYYSQMGSAMPAGVPGMPAAPYGMGVGAPAAPTGGDGGAQPVDPSAASYYYNAAANPQQADNGAAVSAVQTTEDGGQDFSRAWVNYYRSIGQHKEADDLEASLKAKENGGGTNGATATAASQ
ncbi:putative Far upstream element-binding protein 3 [Hypsibius exemplaris]|uniref:Far upstream element-binding protein 3 n=1 Tax=Hypsibius exemplaris TaxID=2072580 RepID=A0A1W0X0X6_HYPEX|nr:putative Far upstream element-binding protein 3 [Hypsibius exemplaris]